MFGRKNGCRYFIDSENVNEVWVNILNILKPEDIIFLFYTDNSAHISCARAVELINIGAKRIKGIRCKEGNNGLDFQMVTQLGAVISKEPKCEYIIVSNDNGFDAVVSYWKQKGYHIRREKSSYCVSLQIPDPNKPEERSQKKSAGKQNYYHNNRNGNRPRIENKKDYKRQQPRLEDKKQQPDNKKVVDLEAKKARKTESGNRKESVRPAVGQETPKQETAQGKARNARGGYARSAAAKPEAVSEPDAVTTKPESPALEREMFMTEQEAFTPEPDKVKQGQKTAASEHNETGMEQIASASEWDRSKQERKAYVPEPEFDEAEQEMIVPQEETVISEPEEDLAGDAGSERHEDDFEPMETPLVIPGTATVADGSRVIDTMYCLQHLCTLIPRKNMALFHNALTCIFEQKDGDEIYAAVKTHPELHTQIWSRYEQDREERVRKYIRLLLDICDYEIQDTDLLYQVYRESYDGSLQGLNIGIMKAFGDETGIRYYRLLRKHINVLTKL